MISKWAYILIGDDRTGKTSFQKHLIYHLCNKNRFTKLHTNLVHDIVHRDAPRKLKKLFTINRSIQEKMRLYKSVDNYFKNYFADADIVVLSSHSHGNSIKDIISMLDELKKRYYNVNAVFFSNHLNSQTENIALLNWHEKIIINNPHNPDRKSWDMQINNGALYFTQMLIKKLSDY